jgi:dimethylglycine dehydrogenase
VTDADARGSEPIYRDGTAVGRCTSGGYGWRTGQSLALAMVQPDLTAPGTEVEFTILGDRHRATVILDSPLDPSNARLRG